jgi:hypothetical protein
MFSRLFPSQIDNTFRGHTAAIWVFVPLLALQSLISVNSIVIGRKVAEGADGIPFDIFTGAGVQVVVALFAMIGLAHLTICLLSWIVLFRYRAFIPLMFALMLFEQLGRKVIRHFIPIPVSGSPPGTTVTIILLALMVVGLGLSLWSPQSNA